MHQCEVQQVVGAEAVPRHSPNSRDQWRDRPCLEGLANCALWHIGQYGGLLQRKTMSSDSRRHLAANSKLFPTRGAISSHSARPADVHRIAAFRVKPAALLKDFQDMRRHLERKRPELVAL